MSESKTNATTEYEHPADRLFAAIDRVNAPVCVGLDPILERMPETCLAMGEPVATIDHFCRGVIEAVAGRIGVCKFQSACFERYGGEGFALLGELLGVARAAGLHVVLDAKRGDIGISAAHYAASVAGVCDWVTVNPYLGVDGIAPFLENGGAFALVRTSNPGGDALQQLQLADGRTVAQAVAGIVAEAGRASVGASGFSSLGAVVGATKSEEGQRLRALMPQQVFLVPGYGAQGGGVADVLPLFNSDGRGALITASRSVIHAFAKNPNSDWQEAVAQAATQFANEVRDGLAHAARIPTA